MSTGARGVPSLDMASSAEPQHAFSVDLEEWFHGVELAPEDWPTQSRLRAGLDPLLALLDSHGVKATFYVLGAVARQQPSLVAELAANGHEIGCHGLMHQFIYRQTPEEFREDLRTARDIVAQAGGVAPRGYRAPYFSVTAESKWALEILADEGFAYDSSIFPVRNDRYGIPDAPRTPFRVADDRLTEVPLTPLPILGQNVPFSGGAYLRILPWWSQVLLWKAATRKGIRVISYIHPWELDPDHPRIELRRRVAATHYPRLKLTERRLDRLFRTYRFGRVDDIAGI